MWIQYSCGSFTNTHRAAAVSSQKRPEKREGSYDDQRPPRDRQRDEQARDDERVHAPSMTLEVIP